MVGRASVSQDLPKQTELQRRRMAAARFPRSDVSRPRFFRNQGHCVVLEQNVLLASEGQENASCSFCLDVPDQRGFAGADGGFLFRAVATPLNRELIGIGDCVELAGKAQSNQYPDWLFEELGKHRDLLIHDTLGRDAAALAAVADHTWQGFGNVLMDFGRLGETAKSLPCGRPWVAVVKCSLTGAEGGLIDSAPSVLWPFIEKFQGVL